MCVGNRYPQKYWVGHLVRFQAPERADALEHQFSIQSNPGILADASLCSWRQFIKETGLQSNTDLYAKKSQTLSTMDLRHKM